MANRGTSKRKSVEQEALVASVYNGTRSPSSGAAATDAGDVRTQFSLIECKCTGGPGLSRQPAMPSFNQLMEWLEKVAEEAWEEGKDPKLAFRFYQPTSRFAKSSGWVDIILYPLEETEEGR